MGSILVSNPGGWALESKDTCHLLCNSGFGSGFESKEGGRSRRLEIHVIFCGIIASILVMNPGKGWDPEAVDTCYLLLNYGSDSGFESRAREGVGAGGFRYMSSLG
jgi:hypothetical protein